MSTSARKMLASYADLSEVEWREAVVEILPRVLICTTSY
jgi:hypothetical protein